MTKEEKRQMFFDIQEHSESYSDEQINLLLADEEIREFAKDVAHIKRAMLKGNPKHVDIDRAWKEFAKKQALPKRGRLKIAASIIGIVFISSIAFAAVVQLGIINVASDNRTETKAAETVVTQERVRPELDEKKDTTDTNPVVFENVELKEILTQMSAFYQVKIVYANEEAAKTRLYFNWDKSKSLDSCIDILNGFDRINLTRADGAITVE